MMHREHDTPAARTAALIERLEARELLTEAEIDDTVERFLARATPANGARLVARAWIDPHFKRRLLHDATTAIAELGLDLSHWAPVRLRAVENTASEHHLIVCTLCSCYPIALLGPSPKWYRSAAYRARAVRDPRDVLAEFGVTLPERTRITVWDSTAELRYFVLPLRPAHTEEYGEAELAAMISRDALIGTALL